jgi:transposase
VLEEVRCPSCKGRAEVKERPVVHYVDLPVYGTAMSLAWKKHRMRCVDPASTTIHSSFVRVSA